LVFDDEGKGRLIQAEIETLPNKSATIL
jgi:hypothetical protein